MIAALVPNPIKKLPIPTIIKLNDVIRIAKPIILMIQAALSVLFLPKLSAMCDITRYPTNDPIYDKDCNKDEIHKLLHNIITP